MDNPSHDYYLFWEDYRTLRETHYTSIAFREWYWNHFVKVVTKGMDHTLSEEEVAHYRQLREDHLLTEEGLSRFKADARIGINMGWKEQWRTRSSIR